MNVEIIGARTKHEGIALRDRMHSEGFETLGFIRFAGNSRLRIAADKAGHVYLSSTFLDFGWGQWSQVNTRSFDRYVRRYLQ